MNPIGDDWCWPPEMDGVIAAPETHHVLFENDVVRVLEVAIAAGQREPEHTHRMPGVMIADQSAIIRYYQQDGALAFTSDGASARTTVVQWMDPEGPHSVENIDSTPYHAFRVELKRG